MRLFEAIIEANHRAVAGDSRAGLRPADYPDSLPIVALTCIDPRLNRLFPEVLGVHEDEFIWLRNAGNIIFDSQSSMMRTLALACAVKGGKEIAVIGHTDCRVRQISVSQLIECFRALGVPRANLPENLVEFFGLFASERQNVINGVNHIRQSPLISYRLPVHGLIVDVESGRLEWLVNGYDQLANSAVVSSPIMEKLEQAKEALGALAEFKSGQLKLPEIKIGDLTLDPQKWLSQMRVVPPSRPESSSTAGGQPTAAQSPSLGSPPPVQAPPPPPAIPVPPPVSVKTFLRRPKR
jgi:carbonic anhydrase